MMRLPARSSGRNMPSSQAIVQDAMQGTRICMASVAPERSAVDDLLYFRAF
jgi:hypothetical protein